MIDKLVEKIKKTQAPIEVGLDPMLSYVPDHVKAKAYEEFGETLEGAAEAIWQFNKAIVDATCDLIPAVSHRLPCTNSLACRAWQLLKRPWITAMKRGCLSSAILSAVILALHPALMPPGILER